VAGADTMPDAKVPAAHRDEPPGRFGGFAFGGRGSAASGDLREGVGASGGPTIWHRAPRIVSVLATYFTGATISR
jgi:hypothetical protein